MGVPLADQYLAGAECFVRLENGDCLHSRNLTNHETGLANRTDDEIVKMIRDGLRPSSTGDVALSPVMPYYVFHNITDADMDAIVAYLRTVPAVEHEVPRSAMVFDVPAPANYLTDAVIPRPMEGYAEMERALRGRYLATQSGACIECHTKHIQGDPNVIDYTKFFAGGEEYAIGLPTVPVAKNLTSDMETGLGSWTAEEIVTALLEGRDKDGAGICPPMPVQPMTPYTGLDPDDALDIAHYIKSLPPIVNAIEDVCTFPPM
jgi:mono/diheme cytochrome c family protein